MAQTQIPSGHPLSQIVVQRRLWLDMKKESYFNRFMSKDGSSIVHEKMDFTKRKSDTMTFGIRYRLTGAPVRGNETMKGKEKKLDFANFSVTLDRIRQAVKDDGSLSRQRPEFNLTDEQRAALVDWGSEFIDQECFDALFANPSQVYFPAGVANLAALGAGNIITLDDISLLKVIARTQRDAKKIPLRPIKVEGQPHLVFLASPDVIYDLKKSADWKQASQNARERSGSNPLFTGAVGMWDNVIIHEHENTPIFSDGGGGAVPYTKCALLGAQALVYAWGERPSIVEELDDYEEFLGHCWRMTSVCEKPKFDSNDHGSIAYYVADTRASKRTTNIL